MKQISCAACCMMLLLASCTKEKKPAPKPVRRSKADPSLFTSDPNATPSTTAGAKTKEDAPTFVYEKTLPPQKGPLIFEAPEQVIRAKPNQKDFTATFKFKNTGKHPITILKIKSACACIVTKLQKTVYKPGESGQFDIKIIFGTAVGRFVKSCFVYTDESDTKKYKIKIGAMIPMFAKIMPRYVRWYKESKATPERIYVKVIHKDPIRVLKVHSSNPDYNVKLVTVKDGREYYVELSPKSTREASRTAISIEMDYPADNHLVYRVVARVSHRTSPVRN